MISKKKLLKKSRLYLILDKRICGHKSMIAIAQEAARAGADIVQLRDKESSRASILAEALRIRKILLNTKTLFIVNDHLDIAKIADSDGVHLGQEDHSASIARKILGKDKIIGVSCANLTQARIALKQGADYIGVGPIFTTLTKPKAPPRGLKIIKRMRACPIPFFVLGGITERNLSAVLSAGAKRIAVGEAICKVKDSAASVRRLRRLLK
jgi:thiamine-phosphate pyrophosphorylase